MKTPLSISSALTPLELKRKITTRQAAELNGVSEEFFKRNYRHLIRKIGPRRIAVELGDAITLPPAGVLDDDIDRFLGDGITPALGVDGATAKIIGQLNGRAPLEQIIRVAIAMLREQATERDRLAVELDRVEVEGLRADAEAWR